MPFPRFIATFPLLLPALLFHGSACANMPLQTGASLTEVLVAPDTNHLQSYASLPPAAYPQNAPPAYQQLPAQPVFLDVNQLRAQAQEIPGVKGVKRMLLGSALMALAVLYFYLFTYSTIMPTHHKLYQKLAQFGGDLMGQPQPTRLEYIYERYTEYVEEHPLLASAEISAFLVGFVFFLKGLITLGRPRKIKYIPVPQEMQ